jgi:collagen type I/II/III/V/XI/XXIV/XXVII alpha
MFDRVRKHLTPATFIALLALVFAITGGAFAATGGVGLRPSHASVSGAKATVAVSRGAAVAARAKAGPRGRTGARGAAGPAGKAGATGPAGAVGATGPAGATGAAGANGASGAGVTSAEFKGHRGNCKEGGTEVVSASGTTYACNGLEGEEGTPGKNGEAGAIHPGETLPKGASETGAWSVSFPPISQEEGEKEVHGLGSVSFPVQLGATPKKATYVNLEKQENKEVPAECKAEVGGVLTEGSAAEPLAAEGYLCVFEGHSTEISKSERSAVGILSPAGVVAAAGKTGAVVSIGYIGPGGVEMNVYGGWAVTAE